jgi:hypothetical protein
MIQAIICDIDGVLANSSHRNYLIEDEDKRKDPKVWSEFFERMVNDEVNEWCREILTRFSETHSIILMTARPEVYRGYTEQWLLANNLQYDMLIMRDDCHRIQEPGYKGFEPDWQLKKRFFEEEIEGKYKVLFVLEYRKSVVAMWRELGLTVLQNDYGDF